MSGNKLQRAEEAMESTFGRGITKIVLVAFGCVLTALLTIIMLDGKRVAETSAEQSALISKISAQNAVSNSGQDLQIAVLTSRIDSGDKKTEAIVHNINALTMQIQAMTIQITKNQDAIERRR